jgi:hypothetical protein
LIVGEDHFSKKQIKARVDATKANGKTLQNELAAQKTSGVDRTLESLGKVKYTSIKKPAGQTKGHVGGRTDRVSCGFERSKDLLSHGSGIKIRI